MLSLPFIPFSLSSLSSGKHLDEIDFVFISHTRATPVSQMTINNALNKVIENTGIKRITAHGLRHAHATILLNNKVSIATVAKRPGNTAEEINRTYDHSDEDADLQAVEIFSEMINS
ncbi:tyrosine-type recombinase/integrase [Oceanobacillus sp. AG]|uniref:tyrosine-type recombinase/integrase n=1 Tax=Oceanobacillus sp. AG TaxID=2681969 RepID=UPI0012EB5A3E|nr:tyrosine-type recombinase/integrase [Oceanobacillus sp. AG]